MKNLSLFIILLMIPSCVSKKYTTIKQLPDGIKSATEEMYLVNNNQKKLLYKKQMIFTRNGRIKSSQTVDSLDKVLQQTEKKLWFIVERYPDKEPYYCKTRWKPNQRERISCYTRKQYKQNESNYHYNSDGSITKIVDNFNPFYTQYFYYTNKELSKIIIKDKNDTLIDEVLVHCETKDEKGSCLKEIRISTKTNRTEEFLFVPKYN